MLKSRTRVAVCMKGVNENANATHKRELVEQITEPG